MGSFIDLAGQTYGRLTVISRADNKGGRPGWLCKCSCGSDPLVVVGRSLRSGTTVSCGCLRNLVGQTFSRLTVLSRAANKGHNAAWVCQCECGSDPVVVVGSNLRSEKTRSCGCINKERLRVMAYSPDMREAAARVSRTRFTHGMTRTSPGLSQHLLVGTWGQMIRRCFFETHVAWDNYGGRGITVHPDWVNVPGEDPTGFANWLAWILANLGERPEGHTLDRVDPDGHYEPGNLRWATPSEQIRNQRRKRAA